MPQVILSDADLAAFWAIGCELEATYVPDDELARAVAAGRVQSAQSWSSMGTAETYWQRATRVPDASDRASFVVVPPGHQAADWTWEERQDDRDTDGVLWAPFRDDQHRTIARAVTGAAVDVVIEEAVRRLVELERERGREHPLVDWLIAGQTLDPELVRAELATTYAAAPGRLLMGVRARCDRDVKAALDAVSESCLSTDAIPVRARWARRMEMLRFAVRAIR